MDFWQWVAVVLAIWLLWDIGDELRRMRKMMEKEHDWRMRQWIMGIEDKDPFAGR